MVERFAREHLGADEVVGAELDVNRFGYATGLVRPLEPGSVRDRVRELFKEEEEEEAPDVGLGRPGSANNSFLSLCKEQCYPPFTGGNRDDAHQQIRPLPVIFHDGRLVPRPTPLTSLIILLWIPSAPSSPSSALPSASSSHSGSFRTSPQSSEVPSSSAVAVPSSSAPFLLLRALVVLRCPLRLHPPHPHGPGGPRHGARPQSSRTHLLHLPPLGAPVPHPHRAAHPRPQRRRRAHQGRARQGRPRGVPGGTTCREPFLLRFSALFAELTDRIVPVAMNYRVGFFHPTTARGWKAMDPIFFFMNPRPIYEVTFLSQLPAEATCSAGKSPHDVANYVQRILAATLGFECTNFTRKDKYRVLAGNDGTVSMNAVNAVAPWARRVKEVLGFLLH
uniref:Glycerol-3-phosphate acyltransferase RAM2/GPAT1-8 HAD-like domain-containing protein n=1 Tax=Ananas comosus var. bracteatus TaxID=296719 RepID=A0A6V7QXC8_ANACO